MQIVSTCLARDLPIYKLTATSLRENLPESELHVVTRKEDFAKFRHECGLDLVLWDEASLIPRMTLEDIKSAELPFPERGSGWYFQQFLKYAFAEVSNSDDHFLIWDADTILLRPLAFLSEAGKPIYTEATENHSPYFETFEALFGRKADREYSFISQHQMIRKSILREMLSDIERRFPSSRNWAWAILENLRGQGTNLFSEYETYGHYLKWKYPDSFEVRRLRWDRHGEKYAGYPPSLKKLRAVKNDFDFLAFEAVFSVRNKIIRRIRQFFPSTGA